MVLVGVVACSLEIIKMNNDFWGTVGAATNDSHCNNSSPRFTDPL